MAARERRDDLLLRLERRVQDLGWAVERGSLADQRLFARPWRLCGLNFLAGLCRGVGMAIGFLLLGALLVYGLSWVVRWNVLGLGRFVAEIVRIVQQELGPHY